MAVSDWKWLRNPAVVVPIIGVIAAVIFGLLQLREDPPVPNVISINPSTVVVGSRFDVLGGNLNLISELLLVKSGTQIRLETIRRGETQWIVMPVEGEVNPSEYSLMIKTTDGKEVSTEHKVNVVAKADVPDRDAARTPALNNTPPPTPTPTHTATPTVAPTHTPPPTPTPTPAPTLTWTCTQLELEDSNQFFPRAIASDTEGNVYVLDNKVGTEEYRVRKFSTLDRHPIEWNVNLEDIDSPFNAPKGIAVELRGGSTLIYVADTGSNVVRLLRVEGNGDQKKVFQRGSWGSDDGLQSPYRPYGIALDQSSKLYVADTGNDRVEIFSSKYLSAYGDDLVELISSNPPANWREGSNDILLRNPSGIALDRKDNIYVVDTGNHRLQKFNPEGEPLFKWEVGSDDILLRNPSGIALDHNDNIYVSDAGNDRVQKFSPEDSTPLGYFQVTRPEGIALDGEDNVYVIASGNTLERCSPVQTAE